MLYSKPKDAARDACNLPQALCRLLEGAEACKDRGNILGISGLHTVHGGQTGLQGIYI